MKGRKGPVADDESASDVTVTIDAVDAAQLQAEAQTRGIPVEQVQVEKFDLGIRRMFPFFSDPNRPSKGPVRH